MSTNVTVPIWQTVNHWAIKGRPATHKRSGSQWIGMPGSENLTPGQDYRLAIVWGPRMRITDMENWLEHVELRIVFDGWKLADKLQHKDSIQFYSGANFAQPTTTSSRVHVPHTNAVFQPYHADCEDHAYFRVTTERGRAWQMNYNIGIYGAIYQGKWEHVIAL